MAALSFKRMLRREGGQTLVETAIVLAIFLGLAFGIVEFGRAWFYSNHLNNSVRAAARYAAVLRNSSSEIAAAPARLLIKQKAEQEIVAYVKVGSTDMTGLVEVDFSPNRGDNLLKRGDTVTVTANLPFRVLTGDIVGSLADFTMTRSASMRFE